MRAYINSLDTGNTPFLEELERFALENEVPIIRKEMQSFMKVLLAVKRPMQVLEVGTAVGFSTLLMCEYGQPDMHITTIENYEKRIPIARENFRKAGKEHRITFLTGDAGEILPTLLGRYDLIFMDAAKGQYIHWLPDIVRLLAPGRDPSVGQRAPGGRADRIPLSGRAEKPHDLQKDAGISL